MTMLLFYSSPLFRRIMRRLRPQIFAIACRLPIIMQICYTRRIQKRGRMLSFIFLFFAILSNTYYLALKLIPPQKFDFIGILADTFGFSIIWFLLSVFFIFLFLLRRNRMLKSTLLKIAAPLKICLCVLIFSGLFVSGLCLSMILNPRVQKTDESADYLIVLGGGVTRDGQLNGTVIKRLNAAADYLLSHPETLAVVSGGVGRPPFLNPYSEAEVLKPALAAYGIDENRILPEDKALDTIQNLIFSAQLLSESEGLPVQTILDSSVILVTSDFHLARAERLAERIGYTDIRGISSKTPAIFIPHNYVREIGAYIKLTLRILLTQKPEHI